MTNQTKNILNYLIDPTSTKVNRLFVLPFENENDRTSFSMYYVPNVQMKDFNVLIDGKFLWYANKKRQRNIRTNYWNGKRQWLHDRQFIGLWILFKILQTELENLDFKQQINFIGRLERNEGTTMFFIIEKS